MKHKASNLAECGEVPMQNETKTTRRQQKAFILRLPPTKAAAVIEGARREGVSCQRWLEALVSPEVKRENSAAAR